MKKALLVLMIICSNWTFGQAQKGSEAVEKFQKELNAEYIETLLNDIQAECVELNFSTCQGHVVELANLLVAYFQKKD